jgi:hypothetical protein
LSRTAGEAKFPLDCSLTAKEVKRLTGFHDLQSMLSSYVADICGGDFARESLPSHLNPLLKIRYEREAPSLLAALSAVLSFTTPVGCFAKSFARKFFS